MHGTQTHRPVALLEFLGEDLRRGLRVQEAVTQDQAHDLLGATVVGFGAAFLRPQRAQAALFVGGQQLVIAGTGVAELGGGGGGVLLEALAFHEHEEPTCQHVVWSDVQGAGRAGELMRIG
jgi:hypothetical protein